MGTKTPPLAPWFVTGLVQTAGSFTFSRTHSGFALYFAIRQAAAEAALLEQVRRFFGGIGRIYIQRGPAGRSRARHDAPAHTEKDS